jgi:hypothetical protein
MVSPLLKNAYSSPACGAEPAGKKNTTGKMPQNYLLKSIPQSHLRHSAAARLRFTGALVSAEGRSILYQYIDVSCLIRMVVRNQLFVRGSLGKSTCRVKGKHQGNIRGNISPRRQGFWALYYCLTVARFYTYNPPIESA